MKIKTGIFGGSFNPIHMGHLILANYLCEFEDIDELWFMVSPQNPLKQQADLLEDSKRLELVNIAIKDYPKFYASDFEFQLPRPSYTINTLDALKSAYPDRLFYLIIGADNWQYFPRWKDSRRLIDENRILVYPRPDIEIRETEFPPNVRLLDTPLLEISSTFIRQAIKEEKDIRYFLHPEVYQTILKSKLYF